MSCYRPLFVERSESGELQFSRPLKKPIKDSFQLPCGNCIGCKLERARQWSVRCQHEQKQWKHSAFVTLTYDDDHLPWHGSLDKDALQKFFKRLRFACEGIQKAPDSKHRPIRYFACGEYGDTTKRAHYHLLLYNIKFEDKKRYGEDTYTSKMLSDLWPFGTHMIGDVTPASSSYVAGYCTKKVRRGWWNEQQIEDEYGVVHPETGEFVIRPEEFQLRSARPGLGAFWYNRFKGDLKHGYLMRDGSKESIPRYYLKKMKEENPQLYEDISYSHYLHSRTMDPDEKSEHRLMVKEICALRKKQFFKQETAI